MSFLKRIFDKKSDNPLVGEWYSDLTDEKTKGTIGDVIVTFTNDKKLIYAIVDGHKKQIINMVYFIDGNTLITDQPSNPQKERTEYYFINADTLILKFNNEESRFVRNR
jgi:hypothetical protein